MAGIGLIATTYGLVRLAYGLFLPDVQASLSMGPTTAGGIAAAAAGAYCVGALAGFLAPDRSRHLILGALLTAALGSAAMALAPDLRTFAAAAVLASTGSGLASPGLVTMIERNVAAPHRDRAQAVVNSGTGPGLVAAGLLALSLQPHWRLGFAVSAALTAVAGACVLTLDRPAPRTAVEGAGTPRRPRSWCWIRVITVPAAAAALLGAASAVVWTYGRAQLAGSGASDATSTIAWIALGGGGLLTVMTARPLSGLHPARAWMASTAGVAASIAVLGLAAGNLTAALAACVVFGWGFVAATSALIAWATRLVPDKSTPGTSLLFVALVLGQGVGSAVAGGVAEHHGLTAAFLLSAVVAVGTALCGLHTSGVDRAPQPRTPVDDRLPAHRG